eukprot:gene11414-biopygen21402
MASLGPNACSDTALDWAIRTRAGAPSLSASTERGGRAACGAQGEQVTWLLLAQTSSETTMDVSSVTPGEGSNGALRGRIGDGFPLNRCYFRTTSFRAAQKNASHAVSPIRWVLHPPLATSRSPVWSPGRNGSGRVRDASVSSNSIAWDASGTRPFLQILSRGTRPGRVRSRFSHRWPTFPAIGQPPSTGHDGRPSPLHLCLGHLLSERGEQRDDLRLLQMVKRQRSSPGR